MRGCSANATGQKKRPRVGLPEAVSIRRAVARSLRSANTSDANGANGDDGGSASKGDSTRNDSAGSRVDSTRSGNAGSRACSRSTGGDSSGGGNNDDDSSRPKRVSARTLGLMHRTVHLALDEIRACTHKPTAKC